MSVTLDPKDPDVAATYEIDWLEQLVGSADRSETFAEGDFVLAQTDTGWYYECTIAGRTSAHYPTWPRADAETVRDGSVVWTCRHPDDASVPSVQSAAWTVPDGLTLDAQVESGYITQVTLSGGIDGVDYEILCRMTPTAGSAIERTITIPVRAQ